MNIAILILLGYGYTIGMILLFGSNTPFPLEEYKKRYNYEKDRKR